jgi:hypothetical protein
LPLPVRFAHSQVLPTPLQLVKLHSHRLRSGPQYRRNRNWSFATTREVCPQASSNQRHTPGTGLSRFVRGIR